MSNHLILLGAPGSGKGTQSKLLIENHGYHHVSTGDLLRSEVAAQTPLGQEVDAVMKSGGLVSDETVFALLKKGLDLSAGYYIFDGFPRTLGQAQTLEKQILDGHAHKALYFAIDTKLLLKRLIARRVCENCKSIYHLDHKPPKKAGVCDECGGQVAQRKDDQEDVVAQRIAVYEKEMGVLLDFYRAQNTLLEFDATAPVEELYQEIKTSLEM